MPIVKRIASEEYTDEKALYEANKAVENVPQVDWNQNDEVALDYVKNRPFYEKTDTVKIVLFDGDVQFDQAAPGSYQVIGSFDEPKEFENGKTYTVTIENEQQDIVCENNALIFVSSELNITFTFMELDILLGIGEYDPWESSYYIKIETTEVSTTVKQLDEKFIPNTIARVEDIPEGAIKPFPYYDVNEVNANLTQYKVNLETLEPGTMYSVQEFASTRHTAFALIIICEDGTEEIITNVMTKYSVYYITIQNKKISLYNVFGNDSCRIDISDKSTANNIVVTPNLISKWLPTINTIEYTPTSEYHPATKKYVDDSVANSIPVPATATIGQTIIIKAVDENGKPTEWEAVDPFVLTDESSGVKYKLSVVSGKLTMTEVTA